MAANPYELTTREILSILFKQRRKLIGVFLGLAVLVIGFSYTLTPYYEATTRLLLQLELVGLSRLGSNPLRVLKDNVPGYQLLREERTTTSPFNPYD